LFIAQLFLAKSITKLIISLAKVYRYWYTFVMSYYETIYEYAADNYGLITSAKARALDVPNVELVKLSHRGRLIRIGHGVYRIVHYISTPLDKYAEAVAIVGEDAHIFGESVLAMHELAFVNPAAIFIATTKRIRKDLPGYIKTVTLKEKGSVTYYEGIPSQHIISAILACRKSIMTDRLENAVDEAGKQGLITQEETEYLSEALRNERQDPK